MRDLKDVRPKLLYAELSFETTISPSATLFGRRVQRNSTALKHKDISIFRLENEADVEILSKISTFCQTTRYPRGGPKAEK